MTPTLSTLSTPSISITLGEQVRQRRKHLGLTREQLARQVGCAAVTIYKIEINERRPSVQVARLLAQHLNIPAEQHEAFVQAARDTNPALSGTQRDTSTGNIPAPLTTLIGRHEDVQYTLARLQENSLRLLTLTGSPGVGKSQLALAVARAAGAMFVDGVFVVQLSTLSAAEQVPAAIAQALGISEGNDASLWDKTLYVLRDQQALLVLDNFEHLLAAAPHISKLLQACPQVKALITSQAALRITGEHEFPVAPLRWLQPDDVADAPAVRLFVQRAQAVQPAFTLNPNNTTHVVEICQRLDGLPLAIELAAARIKLFSPAALLAQLDQRFVVLADGAADAPKRHQTLWNAIDWSYQLLTPDAQRALRCASLFAGSFSLESFQDVADVNAQHALDLVTTLVHHSLITPLGANAPRFMLLESLRAYTHTLLIEAREKIGEFDALRLRHAQHFLALTTQANKPQPSLLQQELDNVRHALRYWVDHAEFDPAARMANALTNFWLGCGLLSEGQAWFDAVLALHTPASLLLANETVVLQYAATLSNASVPAFSRGALREARRYLEEALPLANPLNNAERSVRVLANIGVIDMVEGHYADALPKLDHALAHMLEDGPSILAALMLYNLGVIAGWQGDTPRMKMRLTEAYEMNEHLGHPSGSAQALAMRAYFLVAAGEMAEAQALCARSLQLSRNLGDESVIAIGLGVLGQIELTRGNLADAAEHLSSALQTFREHGRQELGLYCLEALAQVAVLTQQPERAARLLGAVQGIRNRTGIAEPLSEHMRNQSVRELAQAQLASAAFTHAIAEGQAMSFAEVVAYAC